MTLPQNSKPVVLVDEDDNPIELEDKLDPNIADLPLHSNDLIGDLIQYTKTNAFGDSIAIIPGDEMYVESIKIHFAFDTSSDIEFSGWGDSATPLAQNLEIIFQDKQDHDDQQPPQGEGRDYLIEFRTIQELMSRGDSEIRRDGDAVYITMTYPFENYLYIPYFPADSTKQQVFQMDIAFIFAGDTNGLDSGNCTSGRVTVQYRSNERGTIDITDYPT